MTHSTPNVILPSDIEAILEKAVKEPGVNDLLAVLQLSQEATAINEMSHAFDSQPRVYCVSNSGGWGT